MTPGSAGIEIVHEAIDVERLKELAAARFGDLVKAVVDVRQGIMAIGCELHADEEAVLLDAGSAGADLWASTFIRPIMVWTAGSSTTR